MKRLSVSLVGLGMVLFFNVSRAGAQSGDGAVDFTSCPDSVAVGAPITYNLTAEILNQQLSGGLVITDVLPGGLQNVTASAANHADHSPEPLCDNVSFCSVTAGGVTCNLPDTCMDDDADPDDVPVTEDFMNMTINGTAPSFAGPMTLTSHAQTLNPDPNPANNDDSCTTMVVAPGAPNVAALSITKTASANAVVLGSPVTFTLTVHNNGQLVAANTMVTDNLPSSLSLVSATTSAGSCSATNPVTCNLGSMAVGTNVTVTIVANTTALGSVTNSATVTSTTPDNSLADNTASATIQVINGGADLFIEKLANVTTVAVGSNLTYTLLMSNFGPFTAANPVVTDILPASVSFVSASVQKDTKGNSMGSCSGTSTVTCNLNSILSGNNATITIVVTPNVAGTLSNTASIASVTTDPNPTNNSSTVVVTVSGTANNPVPTLTSLNPNSAAAGGPGFFLAATGTNFITGSVLRWNGANLATNFISGTQLTAPVPPADIASAGTASITVVNPTPGGGTSNALTFAITAGTGTVNGPFMVQQPSANPNPVNGAKSTQLNVLGGTTSNGGESVLTYTWITAGPAPVNLSANGTNAAKNATAAFTMLGTYTFIAHIVDTVANASIDSNLLSVTVNPGVASIAVSPKTQILGPGQIFNFIATVLDQFGAAFNTLVTWSTSAGAISLNSGAYTAPLTSQTGTVTATAQGKSDSAQVTILLGGAGGVSVDLSNAKVFPVPFKSNAGLPGITFSKLAPGSHIRLFTMTGRLVQTLDSPTGADVLWTLNNADNKRVASGVYLYIIEGAGQKKEGKVVVIQ